jgi:SAM-dependent methyltransferase
MSNKNTLTNLFLENKYNTDKYDLGYLDNFYDIILPPLKNKCENLLEIGCKNGGSIRLWREFFPNIVKIYGIDIKTYPQIDNTYRIIGDAYSNDVVEKFDENYLDILIDDGPHTYISFLKVIEKYYSKLKPGGVLIIEDIIRPLNGMGVTQQQQDELKLYSKEIGYSSYKEYNLTGKQKTQPLLNMWKSGLYILTLIK